MWKGEKTLPVAAARAVAMAMVFLIYKSPMSQKSAPEDRQTYLPTIERNTGKAFHIPCANLRQTLTVIDTLQEASDDGLSRLFLKFVITHHQMNPIENGIIELMDQVGSQEQYAIVVL